VLHQGLLWSHRCSSLACSNPIPNPNPNPNQVQLTGVLVSNAWLHARGEHPLPVRHWLGVSWAQRTNPNPNLYPNPNPDTDPNPNPNP